ncbi:MAG: PhoD-like phosphatase N-terminal domain-containing protein [Nitrososphaeraceae archaeon]
MSHRKDLHFMGVKWGPQLSSSVAISSIIIIALILPIILSPPISSSLQLDIQLGVFAQQNNSDKPDVVITHGITSGDVTNESAIIWSRANQQAQMNVEYDNNSKFTKHMNTSAISSETTDFTALALIEGLKPITAYNYMVHRR